MHRGYDDFVPHFSDADQIGYTDELINTDESLSLAGEIRAAGMGDTYYTHAVHNERS